MAMEVLTICSHWLGSLSQAHIEFILCPAVEKKKYAKKRKMDEPVWEQRRVSAQKHSIAYAFY